MPNPVASALQLSLYFIPFTFIKAYNLRFGTVLKIAIIIIDIFIFAC